MKKIKIPKINSIFINLKYDWAFKRLFGSKERAGILKRLLNAVFEGEMVIESVRFEDKEVLPPKKRAKVCFMTCIAPLQQNIISSLRCSSAMSLPSTKGWRFIPLLLFTDRENGVKDTISSRCIRWRSLILTWLSLIQCS